MSATLGLLRNSISSIVTLIVGLVVFLSIPSQIALFGSEGAGSVNARTVPYLITSLIVIISAGMIVMDVLNAPRDRPEYVAANVKKDHTNYGRVFLACVAIAAWIALLPLLGFTISTILLVAAVMIIIGACTWWQIIVLSFVLSIPINYLMAIVLQVYLPSGSLFE